MTISADVTSLLEDSNIIYLTVENDLSDFRNKKSPKIKLSTLNQSKEIELVADERLGSTLGFLAVSLFDNENTVVGWNIKDLFSWIKFHYPHTVNISSKIFDLRLCEAFNGETKTHRPETCKDALKRLQVQLSNNKLLKVNSRIYTPLSLEVLPSIETTGIIADVSEPYVKYSSYMIDGALNGRMSSRLAFDGAFHPHGLTDEDKSGFYAGNDNSFLVFDYSHMEITILQWASGDEVLKGIIDSGEDAYAATYKLISGANKCSPANRDWMKKVFLPVVYGCGASRLSETLGLSPKAAQSIIDKLKQVYSRAFAFMDEVQEEAKSGWITDRLGRKYCFTDREAYKARNAIIQGIGALVCQEKLVELYKERVPNMKVVASIHDAYVNIVETKLAENIGLRCKEILESESKLAAGLALTVSTKIGKKWNELITLTIPNREND